MASSDVADVSQKQLFGQPVGVYTLFFTEMWERASYYGNRALLVLFLVDAIGKGRGGLQMSTADAGAIYGIYTGAVYMMTLLGGWIADRLIGQQRSVWYGGILISLGNGFLALPGGGMAMTCAGLTTIVLGTGLLKPNVSVIVGQLYPEGGARRDAGFSIFYSGINLGAWFGPLLAGYIGERYNWHYGFLVASIGMLLGLAQYRAMNAYLGDAGRHPSHGTDANRDVVTRRRGWRFIIAGLVVLAVLAVLLYTGVFRLNIVALAHEILYFIFILALAYFAYVLTLGGLDQQEKKRILAIFILFLGAAAFWSGYEQAGSSLNVFAEDYTQRVVGGFDIPATWFQSVNPWFIILLSPVFGYLWVALARSNRNLSSPFKFSLGLIQLGLGFLVMVFAAKLAVGGGKAGSMWLVFAYFLHTTGELCLSPVGLSTFTKLAPRRYMSQMMGAWFMADAIGSVIAGLVGGQFSPNNVAEMPSLFMQVVYFTVGAGILLLIFSRPIQRKLIGDIQ